jgi:SAM-dependent methyltransferase
VDERLIIDFFTEEEKHWWHIAKRALIKQFICGRDLKILVAGVGGGMICGELSKAGHEVVGIDVSTASCDYVSKTIGIPVTYGDLENPLTFAQDSFDTVILADILEHLRNERQLLLEVFRCLKPKGSVVITVPAYAHLWSSWDIRLNHKRRYSLNDLKNKLIEAGFGIQKLSYCHMLLYPFVYVYRKVLRLPRGQYSEKSDFAVLPSHTVSRCFFLYYHLERRLLKIVNLPFGVSIFALGVKRG